MNTITKILFLLDTKDKTQKDLAEALNTREQTISDWKSGKTKSYMKYIGEIASFLGVSVDFLLNDDVSFETESEMLDSKEAEEPITLLNRIKEMCITRRISIATMLSDCGIAKNTVTNLNQGKDMMLSNAVKIADYLNVSVDYLLGRTDNPNSHKV